MDSPSADTPRTPPVGPPPPPPPSPPTPAPPSPPGRPTPVGAPPAAAPVRSARLPWVVAGLALLMAVVSTGLLVSATLGADAPDGPATSGERGFARPEEAVEYFGSRVAEGDLAGALEVFAVESPVERYSFQAEAERFGVVSSSTWLPASSPGYVAVDANLRRGSIGFQMLFLVRELVAPDVEFAPTIDLDADGLTAAAIEAELAPDGLAGFGVRRVEVLRPTPRGDGDPSAVRAATYGADELLEVAVLYETPDGTFIGGMELLRYGDTWLIWSLDAPMLGLVLAEIRPSSESAFDATVAGING